jgi:hypothetical protein
MKKDFISIWNNKYFDYSKHISNINEYLLIYYLNKDL